MTRARLYNNNNNKVYEYKFIYKYIEWKKYVKSKRLYFMFVIINNDFLQSRKKNVFS